MRKLSKSKIKYIIKNIQHIDISNIANEYYLTFEICDALAKAGKWNAISHRSDISENFIREFRYKINWKNISGTVISNLSDAFIREFQDNLWWDSITRYKDMSDEFIIEFQHKINMYTLYTYKPDRFATLPFYSMGKMDKTGKIISQK